MNRQTLLLSGVALALIAGTAVLLSQMRGGVTLAPPGIRTHALPGSIRLEADLPKQVLNYNSEWMETDKVAIDNLPTDTSFGQRRYEAPDGFWMALKVVLMGQDRASIHKPQICLPGQGWQIDEPASAETHVRVQRPYEYDLPLVELVLHKTISVAGQNQTWSGIYVYWYVADDAVSASTSNFQRMYLMTSRLLRTGVLQRWAYVTCFTVCAPGQEAAAFNRMKPFIAALAPEFHLFPRPKPTTAALLKEGFIDSGAQDRDAR
jgi:hypothetical protein